MAEREYIITIKNESGTGAKQTIAGEAGQADSNGGVAKSKEGSGKSTAQTALTKGLVAWKKVKPWVNQVISGQLNVVNIRDGSTELAQKRQFTYQIATEAVGFAESVVAGAAVGGIYGAVAGGIASVGMKLLSYYNNQQAINERFKVEQETIRMNYIRAGARGSRSRNE